MTKSLKISLICFIILGLAFAITGCSGGDGSVSGNIIPPESPDIPPVTQNQLVMRVSPGGNPYEAAQSIGGEVTETFHIGAMEYAVVSVPLTRSLEDIIPVLNNHDQVDFAEPNLIFTTNIVPNDPAYTTNQYCHNNMNSEQGWNVTTGSSSIVVAIIDTGVNGQHPEFSGRMTAGYDFVENRSLSGNENSDPNGHGTHVAGIACATGNNGIGVAGLDWQSRIMPVRVLNQEGSGSLSAISSGIAFAADNGAHVINMSLGGKGSALTLQDAINYAVLNNVVVFSASGNDGIRSIEYPAACQGVIAVGSTNAHDVVSDFSSFGSHVSVCAPGSYIYSTNTEGGYSTFSGTSMASPQGAGLASLILSRNSGWTPAQVKSQIENTADDIEKSGFDEKAGYGRINVGRALGAAAPNNYGSVRALITDGGSDVSGADLLIKNNAGSVIAAAKSDYSGDAYFFFLPAGSYTVSCHLRGQTKTTSITVSAGSQTSAALSF